MLYSCTHMATVGFKGLNLLTIGMVQMSQQEVTNFVTAGLGRGRHRRAKFVSKIRLRDDVELLRTRRGNR